MPATLTLKSPDSESHVVDTKAISRRTTGQQLLQVKAPTWERLDEFNWAFRGLSQKQKEDFVTFVCDNAGLTIIADDHKGDRWIGIIVSNPVIQQTSRAVNPDGSDCDTDDDGSLWEVQFQFQGVRE